MPIYLPTDTLSALGGQSLPKLDSRSLRFTRYAEPERENSREDSSRTDFFRDAFKLAPYVDSLNRWYSLLKSEFKLPNENLLYAKLCSRLALHLSGGVMENAGIILDRYGMPYIPGSGVKGCARRCAIHLLHSSTENTNDNMVHSVESLANTLAAIAKIFGWTMQDWDSTSDFAWAIRPDLWNEVRSATGLLLINKPCSSPEDFSDRAGSVTFLPAYPLAVGYPRDDLELDILTNHHTEYYKGERSVALDDEEPGAIVEFPSVAANMTFVFALTGNDKTLIMQARQLLTSGLSHYGIGAKTAAGYGWFDTSEEIQDSVRTQIEAASIRAQAKEERERLEKEMAAKKQADEVRRLAAAELKAKLATLPADQQEDEKLKLLTDDQFRTKLQNFIKPKNGPTELEKSAIVRALRGPRVNFWQDIRDNRKGDWPGVVQEIRALSNKLNLGKMP